MALTDLAYSYLDRQGHLNRWMRAAITPPVLNKPGAPTSVQAVLVGTTLTVTWGPPTDDGGDPITDYYVTCTGKTAKTITLPAALSTTFTVTAGGSYTVSVAADNSVGRGPAAGDSVSPFTRLFPAYTDPLHTGKILTGASEADDDGRTVKRGWEWYAPEADTGIAYGIIKVFYSGGSVESCFTPGTGGIAKDVIKHRAKGRMILANVAIQQSTSTHFTTWAKAGDYSDSVVRNTYTDFVRYMEEGADMPDWPIWVCMPHEAQQSAKLNTTPGSGMTAGDYADMQWTFRRCMDDYAISKVGGDGSAYKWKHLAFGGIHVGDVFGLKLTDDRNIEHFYVGRTYGGSLPKRVHDFVGGDPYQNPIGQVTTSPVIGRTGVPGWSNAMNAMANWCKDNGYPCVQGEMGIHNTDGDAGVQLMAWWSKVTSGQWDICAVIYFHSAPDVKNAPLDPAKPGSGIGRFLFTDLMANNIGGNYGSNGGMSGGVRNPGLYSSWQTIMRDSRSVHAWDLGYARPPGV